MSNPRASASNPRASTGPAPATNPRASGTATNPRASTGAGSTGNVTGQDKTKQVLAQVDEVKSVMQDNIGKMLENHEKADLLVEKTDDMRTRAEDFRKVSRQVKNQMWWRNMKLTLIIALVILAVLAVILVPIIVTFWMFSF